MKILFVILMIYSHEMCTLVGNMVTMKEIPLTKGKVALVDDEDYDRLVAMGKWAFYKEKNGTGYAARNEYLGIINGKVLRKTILMHRVIMNAPSKLEVDHRDRQKLNNQK